MGGSIVVAVILACGAIAFAVAPLLRGRQEARRGDEVRRLTEEKEAAVRLLADLEHDHQTGKLLAEDYQMLRRDAEGRAIEAMKRLDDLGADLQGDPAEQLIRRERERLRRESGR